MMAAARRLVHSLHHPIRRNHVCHDRTNSLDMNDDMKLFQCSRFPHCELLKVTDNFEDDVTFKLTPFFLFHIVQGAGNVASGVQDIGEVCPHSGFLLICHSTRLTEAGSCYLCTHKSMYTAASL